MAIVRRKSDHVLVNKTVIEHDMLSLEAKGLYAILCAKEESTDDYDLHYFASEFLKDVKTVKSLLNDLVRVGAIKVTVKDNIIDIVI